MLWGEREVRRGKSEIVSERGERERIGEWPQGAVWDGWMTKQVSPSLPISNSRRKEGRAVFANPIVANANSPPQIEIAAAAAVIDTERGRD